MQERLVVVGNDRGIHLRPSGVIAQALRGYTGHAYVSCHGGALMPLSASPLSIMGLALRKGDRVMVRVDGAEEVSKLNELSNLFSRKYDFT